MAVYLSKMAATMVGTILSGVRNEAHNELMTRDLVK